MGIFAPAILHTPTIYTGGHKRLESATSEKGVGEGLKEGYTVFTFRMLVVRDESDREGGLIGRDVATMRRRLRGLSVGCNAIFRAPSRQILKARFSKGLFGTNRKGTRLTRAGFASMVGVR